MSSLVADSIGLVKSMIHSIESSPLENPLLFVDLEGINLSRHGSIAILQILVPPNPVVNLVDVYTLKASAFETPSASGVTLKAILESEQYPKVFFDVRNDSDALYAHFKVDLRCIIDLQLLEFATRRSHGKFVSGLSKCISTDANLPLEARWAWTAVKDAGGKLFAPEKGGSYEVFQERPLPQGLANYCAQDVAILPRLLEIYADRLPRNLADLIGSEGKNRVVLSQRASFNGKGRHMAEGPRFNWNRYVDPQERGVHAERALI